MHFNSLVREHRSLLVLAALAAPVALAATLSAFRDSVTAATAVLALVLVVVIASATGDRLVGIVAALSSGAAFDYFLTEPYGAFPSTTPRTSKQPYS